MSTLRDSALYYHKLGFAVVPLVPRQKRPATERGFNEWAESEQEIEYAWGRQPSFNVGASMGAPSGNIICIDIDIDDDKGYDGMEFLRKWEREHGELPETVSAITGRGGSHLFYRVDREVRPSTNDELHIDIRGDGSGIVLPPSVHPDTGREYQWENHPEDYDFAIADANVYAFLDAIRKDKPQGEKFKAPETQGEGGRNQTLFKMACSLQSQGMSDAAIKHAVHAYNAEQCNPPLPNDEVERIIASACGYEKGNAAPPKPADGDGPKKGFRHDKFGDILMEKLHMCYIDGAPAVWNGECYEVGRRAVEHAMINLRKNIKDKDRRETLKYLEICAPRETMADKKYIAFQNCVLDIETLETVEMSPSMRIANLIPHKWNPNVECEVVDNVLGRIACDELDIWWNLCEIIGLCMYRGTELTTCPILLGKGSNGKSTFMNMLHRLLGEDNVASLDIATIGERFQTVPLMGKLANLGDDVSNEFISGSKAAVIKKVVTGDYVQAEYKGGDTFKFKPYCTLVFTANEMPRIGDNSYGMMRRLHPVPLNADFSKADAEYDPNIERKLGTEAAMERAIFLGVQALQGCIERHGMTENDESKRELERIRLENSSVYSWAVEELNFGSKNAEEIDGKVIKDMHDEYKAYCESANFMAINRIAFTRQINQIYGTESASGWAVYSDGKKSVRMFRKKGRA